MSGSVSARQRSLANTSSAVSRREILLAGGSALAGTGLVAAFSGLAARRAGGVTAPYSEDYGPLEPRADRSTGLELLLLPPGFEYWSYGWTGDPLDDGSPTPPAHDGMGIADVQSDRIVLVRNHENSLPTGAFGARSSAYDPSGSGGTTSLIFNPRSGKWLNSWVSLNGTSTNCGGGATPWNSWLSCEETLNGRDNGFLEPHGWVFEVRRGEPLTAPEPLVEMGRFAHEAVAVDPASGYVYETEDRGRCGFYRFVPRRSWAQLHRGGRLQMLRVTGVHQADLSRVIPVGRTFEVDWVDIDDPGLAHTPGSNPPDAGGVFSQGYEQGGASFRRLEGCWYDRGRIYFVSTIGGIAGSGQVWAYEPRASVLTLIFDSPGPHRLNGPDNIAVSPRGALVLCEDGGGGYGMVGGNRLLGLSPAGSLFTFAENNIVLEGQRNGITGDFRSGEWAGATFSPEGRWLFVNIQRPGVTFAITGPWNNGGL